MSRDISTVIRGLERALILLNVQHNKLNRWSYFSPAELLLGHINGINNVIKQLTAENARPEAITATTDSSKLDIDQLIIQTRLKEAAIDRQGTIESVYNAYVMAYKDKENVHLFNIFIEKWNALSDDLRNVDGELYISIAELGIDIETGAVWGFSEGG